MCGAQEAVQCRDLGKWQFKALNAGIALAGFAHVMALYEWWHGGGGGPGMPAVLSAWAFAGARHCAHIGYGGRFSCIYNDPSCRVHLVLHTCRMVVQRLRQNVSFLNPAVAVHAMMMRKGDERQG